MIRIMSCMALISLLVFALPINGISEYDADIINKIRLSDSDIPDGYMYGKIPNFARSVLKDNPWMMDNNAIRRLTKKIYPEGNYNRVLKIHVTILSGKEKPYGDDIVCYIILYKDSHAARDELKKISRFVDFNKDRAILVKKMNLVIFFHVDDTKDFHYIRKIATRLVDTLKRL